MEKVIEKVWRFAQYVFSDSGGHHDWDHTRRVLRLCLLIAKNEENVDLEVLVISAILHDIARSFQDESKGKICHAKKGAEIARRFLEKQNVDSKKIDAVCHCILAHRSRNNIKPESLEAKILFDADKLDGIGATGIARAISFSGANGAKIHNKGVDISKVEDYSADDTLYVEYEKKLKFIRGEKLYTETARNIAEDRQEFMEIFLERLDDEWDGKK